MNAFPGLTWEFSERAKTIDFMDMTISINKSNNIETTRSKKDSTCTFTSLPTPLTRQDYSLVLYTVLCSGSSPYVQTTRINYNKQRVFLTASLPVATKENEIRPLFHKAITRAKTYSGPTQAEDDDHNSVILHLPFHPNDPASSRIQAEWRTHVAKPQWKLPLEHMKHPKTKEKCNIKRMIIAYKHPMNLGNLLSHRDLATGPPVSSYLYD